MIGKQPVTDEWIDGKQQPRRWHTDALMAEPQPVLEGEVIDQKLDEDGRVVTTVRTADGRIVTVLR